MLLLNRGESPLSDTPADGGDYLPLNLFIPNILCSQRTEDTIPRLIVKVAKYSQDTAAIFYYI